MANQEVVRLSVNLSPEVADVLRELADQRGMTISAVVREAIGMEKFVRDQQKKESQILIKEKDGTLKQLVLR